MTKRYNSLVSRIKELERIYLPKSTSPIGNYSNEQNHMVNGFCAFSHAEIESYIEDSVRHVVDRCGRMISRGRYPHKMIAHIVSWYLISVCTETADDGECCPRKIMNFKKKPLIDAIKDCVEAYYVLVSKNNGIKDEDMRRLLAPIGIQIDSLDQTWVADMNSFGKTRGDIVHKSLATMKTLDPIVEKNKVAALLAGLKILDSELLLVVR